MSSLDVRNLTVRLPVVAHRWLRGNCLRLFRDCQKYECERAGKEKTECGKKEGFSRVGRSVPRACWLV